MTQKTMFLKLLMGRLCPEQSTFMITETQHLTPDETSN
jgi:hypothetical protein